MNRLLQITPRDMVAVALEPLKADPEPAEAVEETEQPSDLTDERMGFAEGTQTQLFN